MSRKTCFMIFIAAVVVILASFVIGFSPVTREVSKVFAQMESVYIALPAVIAALLLSRQKHYWLIMLGLAVVIAAVVQAVVLGHALMTIALLYKIIAVIVYVYLITLMRFML